MQQSSVSCRSAGLLRGAGGGLAQCSGGFRILKLGEGGWTGANYSLPPSPPVLSSPPFHSSPSLLSLSLTLPPFLFPPFPSLTLRSRPPVSQRGLGQSPSRNRVWCILALKYDIWWQQF